MRKPIFSRQRICTILWYALLTLFPAAVTAGAGLQFSPEENAVEPQAVDTISRCVVYLENDTRGKYITGLLIDSSGPVVVTNYHLLSSDTDTVRVYLNTAENAITSFPCALIKGDRACDLAAFRIALPGSMQSPEHAEVSCARFPSTNCWMQPASFADPGDIRRGRRVIFLGFPLNYGIIVDRVTHTMSKKPILRSGMVASEIFDNEFLIDAMVNNGNSGSPVFTRSENGDYRLVGVIKEYQHDTIKIHRDDGGLLSIPHNAGLGVVVPAAVVRTFIESLSGTP